MTIRVVRVTDAAFSDAQKPETTKLWPWLGDDGSPVLVTPDEDGPVGCERY